MLCGTQYRDKIVSGVLVKPDVSTVSLRLHTTHKHNVDPPICLPATADRRHSQDPHNDIKGEVNRFFFIFLFGAPGSLWF